MIVERTTVLGSVLPLDGGRVCTEPGLDTLEALFSLFVAYIRKAREPNAAAYTWVGIVCVEHVQEIAIDHKYVPYI